MNAVCLVVDRLHRGFLGPYGNTWLETPASNRLAAAGFAFDQFIANSPVLSEAYAAYWDARHPLRANQPSLRLIERLGQQRVNATLVSDDDSVSRWGEAAGFDEIVRVTPRVDRVVESVDDTNLAMLMAQAIAALEDAREPFLLWVHVGSLVAAFDAPLELRNSLVDENEPLPPQGPRVPRTLLPEDCDPDELLGLRRGYAGQIMVWEDCLAALLDALAEHPARERTLTSLISPRGFCLGEHGRVGPWEQPLLGELVHPPWLIWAPSELGVTQGRSQALVEPVDLAATLAEWFQLADLPATWPARSLLPLLHGFDEAPRDRVWLGAAEGQRALRTPGWFLRLRGERNEGLALYAKPDDAWEQNEIASRCPEVAEQMAATLAAYETAAAQSPPQLQPLPDALGLGATLQR